MKDKIILVVAISMMALLGCQVGYAESKDVSYPYHDFTDLIKQNEDYYLLFRCLWGEITYCIEGSEFCAIAEVAITKEEPIGRQLKRAPSLVRGEWIETEELARGYGKLEIYPRNLIRREGKFKIKSIIYGDPETTEIPFSYEYNDMDFSTNSPWLFKHSIGGIGSAGPAHFIYSKADSIVLGAGKGKSAKIIRAIGENKGFISIEVIKEWREIFKDPLREYEDIVNRAKYDGNNAAEALIEGRKQIKRRYHDRLVNSNNMELLLSLLEDDSCISVSYPDESDKDVKMESINTLAYEGKDTPERRFLSYGLSVFMFREKQLEEHQRKTLIDIAADKFSRITQSEDGIKYLRLISLLTYDTAEFGGPFSPIKEVREGGPTLFERVPELKDKLKPIALSLSEKFKDEPDFPEWQNWVNKIFPADTK